MKPEFIRPISLDKKDVIQFFHILCVQYLRLWKQQKKI
ncbi:hypothetical protein HMPREF9303_1100 [Prevotella denticola CRIS 18C-A]|uniref:Uncharacterized protein n=1 Tax=Prevotella denticola CRIS 18C-A TaxID=944557 RepID=F0H9Y0_9BACT|nr:hypothetical protein HMPREF9303_1100 [Prevotella denticola CRIS 18C-A]